MEKTKMSYQNGNIYAIHSYQTKHVYYGSTTQPLSKRMGFHKSSFKCWQNKKSRYMTSFEIMKFDDCYIELVENYPCDNKYELERREGEIIRAHDNAINKIITRRTKGEYYADNLEKIKQRSKQYYADNIEKINTKHACQCGGKYTKSGIYTHVKTKKHTNYLETIQV